MPIAPHNSVVFILKPTERRVPDVLLLRAMPNMHIAEEEVHYRPPGGTAEGKETPEETARRETRQETGLKIPSSAPLNLFYKREFGRHTKYGFWIMRSDCRGSYNKFTRHDRKNRIIGRTWVPLDEAQNLIPPSEKGSTHNEMLRMLYESLMRQRA